MVSARWLYDQATQQYVDARANRPLTDDDMRDLRDQFLEGQRRRIESLMTELAEQRIALSYWEQSMREVVKDSHGVAYVLGKGGRNAMHPADWGRIGRHVQSQFVFLHDFARDIATGAVSQAQAQARANLYVGSARAAMGRGMSAAAGGLSLPQYPGDGSTPCLGNCRCWWRISRTTNEWEVTWVSLGGPTQCDECARRAQIWAPLRIPL